MGLHLNAYAFEQTQQVPSSQSNGGAAPSAGALSLDVPEAPVAKETGPEISIPGIGSLGSLPKFDFGLELLYGAEDVPSVVEDDPVDSDIRIRGSVKHKF